LFLRKEKKTLGYPNFERKKKMVVGFGRLEKKVNVKSVFLEKTCTRKQGLEVGI